MKDNNDKMKPDEEKKKVKFPHKLRKTCVSDLGGNGLYDITLF